MQTISSTEVRNNFAAVLENVRNEPVMIQKQGRNAAVLLSCTEYDQLTNGPLRRFNEECDEIGRKAEARGLTEEMLMEILAEDDAS